MLTYCMLGGVVFSGSRFVFWMLILCLMYNLLQCLFLLVMCNEVKDQRTEEYCFCKYGFAVLSLTTRIFLCSGLTELP
jgi:hypothetical protein